MPTEHTEHTEYTEEGRTKKGAAVIFVYVYFVCYVGKTDRLGGTVISAD